MTTTAFPVFAEGLLGTLSLALRNRNLEEWLAEEVEIGTALCRQELASLRGVRRECEDLLTHGVEARRFAAAVEPLLAGIGREVEALTRHNERMARFSLSPALQEFLSEAQVMVREATDLCDFLAAALAKTTAPSRPIDWNRVREVEAAYTRGESKPFTALRPD